MVEQRAMPPRFLRVPRRKAMRRRAAPLAGCRPLRGERGGEAGEAGGERADGGGARAAEGGGVPAAQYRHSA